MRLIDADELLTKVDCSIELVSVDETMYIPYVDYVDEICNTPTVKAIPIEWMINWVKKYNDNLEPWFKGRTSVDDMLEEWKKNEGYKI